MFTHVIAVFFSFLHYSSCLLFNKCDHTSLCMCWLNVEEVDRPILNEVSSIKKPLKKSMLSSFHMHLPEVGICCFPYELAISLKYFNIKDSHLGKHNTGLVLEIDAAYDVSESAEDNSIELKWKEFRKRWEQPRQDGDFLEELDAIVPNIKQKISDAFKGCIQDY